MEIFLIIFALIMVWFAIRLKRHPEKDGNMKKVMSEQRGTEYEKRMQKFFMINYLTAGLAVVTGMLLQIIFGIDDVVPMLIAGCVPSLMLVITTWRFTGEFSKFGMVFFAAWLVGVLSIYYWCITLK